MPLFEKPPIESLPMARDRWTPLYLEHGRLEVDDSSIKWINSSGDVIRIPIATISVLLMGPGTSVTHAAIKVCADSNTPVCWVGEDSMKFYARGVSSTHDNSNARLHASYYANPKKRVEVARKMFKKRFPNEDIADKKIQELRGMEGIRVRSLYQKMSETYAVSWKGRKYDKNNWFLADNVNKALSSANSCLYAFCGSIICSMGFLPELGFIHSAGSVSFVYDIADIYKEETTFHIAFALEASGLGVDRKSIVAALKEKIEKVSLSKRIPEDLKELFS